MSIFSYKYYEKLKQKKYRQEEKKFLIEGDNLVTECLHSDRYKKLIESVFVRRDYENGDLLKKIYSELPDIRVEDLNESVFNKLSETVNPQGIIACVNNFPEDQIVKPFISDMVVALDNINDPGNLGTIIRTCYWFGIKEIVLSKDTADFYNPKVIRASQGAVFHTDLYKSGDLNQSLKDFELNNYIIYLSDLSAGENISDLKLNIDKKYVLVFGNESNGISKSITAESIYSKIKIKGYSDCESLNVAVSAGIVINEFRNRTKKD